MPYVLPFLLAMVVTIGALPVFARMAAKWRIIDQPGARKVHSTPIPRSGGIAMAAGVLVAAVVAVHLEPADQYFLLAAGVLTLFGALDDRFDLDYRIKLVGQLIAVSIVVFAGGSEIHALTLQDRVWLP